MSTQANEKSAALKSLLEREFTFDLFVGIILPFFSFLLTARNGLSIGAVWQDGEVATFFSMMLRMEVAGYFYLFLFYSMLCLLLLLIDSSHYSKFFLVRFGIYTGVVLALQYAVIVVMNILPDYPSLFRVGLILGIRPFFQWIPKEFRRGVGITLVVVLGIIALSTPFGIVTVFLYGLFYVFAAGPFLNSVLYGYLSYRLLKDHENFSKVLRFFLVLGSWLAVYIAAWRMAILKTYEVYSRLPTIQPHCYIATAAAQGHSAFVKSEIVFLADGSMLKVNAQLRYLKFGELALIALMPHIHKGLRTIYDRLGKALARGIVDSLIADMTYIALKPFEWGTRIVLKMLFPDLDALAEKIYGAKEKK